ncbi:MAG: hypothetical protein C0501_14315 [Isosphaera sp.]|nr:hypothetical protein [Isosphaera sp.]
MCFFACQELLITDMRTVLCIMGTAIQPTDSEVVRWRFSPRTKYLGVLLDVPDAHTANSVGLRIFQRGWRLGLRTRGKKVTVFPEGQAGGLFDPPPPPIARPDAPLEVGEPFDVLPDVLPVTHGSEHADQRQAELLAWLTASGSGRWEVFARVAVQIRAAADPQRARALLQNLLLLGHIERSHDGTRWQVAPPVIVASPSAPVRLIWCGGRVQSLRGQIPSGWRVNEEPQADSSGPPRWTLEMPDGSDCQALRPIGPQPDWNHLSCGGDVTTRLARLLPRPTDLLDQLLPPLPHLPPPDRAFYFDGNQFLPAGPQHLRLRFDGVIGQPGLYRLEYDSNPPRMVLAYIDPTRPSGHQIYRGDWQTLRFLALPLLGRCPQARLALNQA